MGFTWCVIQDVPRVPMLQAADLNPLKLNGIKDFRGFTVVTKLFSH